MYARYAKLRDERKVTDFEISKQTGISTSTLTDWKKGRYTPKVDKLLKLADYFGVPVDLFIREEEV